MPSHTSALLVEVLSARHFAPAWPAAAFLPSLTVRAQQYPPVWPSSSSAIPAPAPDDREYGGLGKITGTVKFKGDPVDTPVRRRVRLIAQVDWAIIREVWSDPITGYYEFYGINPSRKYTVYAIDYERALRMVLADNLVPDPLS